MRKVFFVGIMMDKVVVVGGANIDLCGCCYSPIVANDSNIGKVTIHPGGVGHNIALNLAKLGVDVSFITAIGNDHFGSILRKEMSKNMDISSSLNIEGRSGIYLYVSNQDGEMYVAVNDMEAIKALTKEYIYSKKEIIENADVVIIEANLNQDTALEAVKVAKGLVLSDAVSTQKVERLIPSFPYIDVFKPNLIELEYITKTAIVDKESLLKASYTLFDKGLKSILLTLGKRGSLYLSPSATYYCNSHNVSAINTTGAGDSFLAGFAYGMIETREEREAIKYATSCSALTVMSQETVTPSMKKELIIEMNKELEVNEEIPRLF